MTEVTKREVEHRGGLVTVHTYRVTDSDPIGPVSASIDPDQVNPIPVTEIEKGELREILGDFELNDEWWTRLALIRGEYRIRFQRRRALDDKLSKRPRTRRNATLKSLAKLRIEADRFQKVLDGLPEDVLPLFCQEIWPDFEAFQLRTGQNGHISAGGPLQLLNVCRDAAELLSGYAAGLESQDLDDQRRRDGLLAQVEGRIQTITALLEVWTHGLGRTAGQRAFNEFADHVLKPVNPKFNSEKSRRRIRHERKAIMEELKDLIVLED